MNVKEINLEEDAAQHAIDLVGGPSENFENSFRDLNSDILFEKLAQKFSNLFPKRKPIRIEKSKEN